MRLHVRATKVSDYNERKVHVKYGYRTSPAITVIRNIRYGANIRH
jgi:hypothetical protein